MFRTHGLFVCDKYPLEKGCSEKALPYSNTWSLNGCWRRTCLLSLLQNLNGWVTTLKRGVIGN